MSFKNNHINIDRTNYEEYFLLYVDNELTPDQRLAVEDFVNYHPDLKEELELISATVLDAEPICLFDKDLLLSHQMKKDVVDDQLLMYLDNELSLEQAGIVETKLTTDREYKFQYEMLLNTKLDKNETIIYPYKEELYRKENERSIRPFFVFRIAAAVIILLTSALFYMFSTDVTNDPPVIVHQTVKPQQQKKNIIADQTAVTTIEEVIEEKDQEDIFIATVSEKSKEDFKLQTDFKTEEPVSNSIENHIAYTDLPKVDKQTSIDAIVFQQQNINNQPVTTIEVPAYTKIDASESLVPGTDAFEGDEDKKGSVRGFLRKATRFIERRTGFNAVNEDDELLIGAVAIKLK